MSKSKRKPASPPFGSLPQDTQIEIARLVQAYQYDRALQEAAKAGLDFHPSALYRAARKVANELPERVLESDNARRRYDDYVVADTRDKGTIIIGDVEVPDEHAEMLDIALRFAKAQSVQVAVWAGDIIATDHAALTQWVETWQVGGQHTYESDIGRVRNILSTFADLGIKQILIEGNHDDRISRSTGGAVHLGMLLMGVPHVEYSRYGYCYLNTHRGYAKIIHPKAFSKNPITVAAAIYDVECGPTYYDDGQIHKPHIVVAHCHRRQSGMSPDGIRELHSIGATRDSKLTKYYSQHSGKLPKWDNGFIYICPDGYIYNLGLTTTDWRKWGV